MVATIDVKTGELYSLDLEGEDGVVFAEFVKEMRDGTLRFKREGTDLDIFIDHDEFEQMRSDGSATRIRVDRDGHLIEERDIDPLTFLNADDPNITVKERATRLLRQERHVHAQVLRFYVMLYDAADDVGRGRDGIRTFFKKHRQAAREEGYSWEPSPTTLLRAVDECGSPGARHLIFFLNRRKGTHDREKRWPRDVIDAANRAIEAYWDDQAFTISDALRQFRAEANSIEAEHFVPVATPVSDVVVDEDAPHPDRYRPEKPASTYPIPVDETIRLWIHQNADWWHWAQRYGVKNANSRYRGRGRAIEATRPLEYVMFDHTKIDAWAVVQDDEGQPILVARAWLTFAVDVYSRMILGAVIGFEPPSLHSVSACLRQVVARKTFLLERYGEFRDATDGWGRPFNIIVDNGKEFVSPSFQAACEAAGIDVTYAPVGMPTFKAYVERAFGTFNSILWHKLPGGLPLTPQERRDLGLEAEANAVYTKAQLEAVMWDAIVKLYHIQTHSALGMSPSMTWQRGIRLHNRASVDDAALLEKIVGRGKNRLLSVEGLTVDGHRFHEPALTSMLMNRLAKFGKQRQQRKGLSSSRTVPVRVNYDPGDVSKVHVWDPTTRTYVTLPNWDRLYAAGGLSWYAADRIAEYAKQQDIAFRSDAEKLAARMSHRQFLLDILPGIKAVEASRRARVIEPLHDLVRGDRLETKKVDRRDSDEIVHDTAAKRAEHPMMITKGRPFGGKAGAAKGQATRKRNKVAVAKTASVAPVPQTASHVPPAAPTAGTPKVDMAALQARVQARLAAKSKQNGDGK